MNEIIESDEIKKSKPILISIDIETDFSRMLKKNPKMLNIGWCSFRKLDKGKEFWIWQNENKLYYPDLIDDRPLDQKYIKILEKWRVSAKTKLEDTLRAFLADVAGNIVTGWNIKGFDIPIIRDYIKRYLGIEWNPLYFDGYLEIRRYVKEHERLRKQMEETTGLTASGKNPSLTAESMYRYFTGCMGYKEHHTALYDAQDERHVISLMKRDYKLDPMKMVNQYIPKEKPEEE